MYKLIFLVYEEVKTEISIEIIPEEATTKKQVCTPGQIFTNKCNLCKCSLDGTSSVCTEKTCVERKEGIIFLKIQINHKKTNKQTLLFFSSGPDGNYETTTLKQICIPDKIFKEKCNICKCSADGTAAVCTKKQCLEKTEGPSYNYYKYVF